MICAHCRYSEGILNGLWCKLKNARAVRVCKYWEREPGADDE